MGSCCGEQKPASNGATERKNGNDSTVHNNVKVSSMLLSWLHMRRNESPCVPTQMSSRPASA